MATSQSILTQQDIGGVEATTTPGYHENRSKWIVLRMLIPTCGDDKDVHDMGRMEEICEWTKANITIHKGPCDSEVAVVMVCANQETSPSTSVVSAFLGVHDLFLERLRTPGKIPVCSTRLLVPIAQARSLIANNIINSSSKEIGNGGVAKLLVEGAAACGSGKVVGWGEFDGGNVAATTAFAAAMNNRTEMKRARDETISMMFHDDVILEVHGMIDRVFQAILSIVSRMIDFRVDQRHIFKLKDQMVATKIDKPLSNLGISVCEGESTQLVPFGRRLKVQRFKTEIGHSRCISPSLVGGIIGDGGSNIKRIWETCSAIIIISPFRGIDGEEMLIKICCGENEGGTFEVKKAEKLMQESITAAEGPCSFFEHVLIGSGCGIPKWRWKN